MCEGMAFSVAQIELDALFTSAVLSVIASTFFLDQTNLEHQP